jgi:hypothetical protein
MILWGGSDRTWGLVWGQGVFGGGAGWGQGVTVSGSHTPSSFMSTIACRRVLGGEGAGQKLRPG